MATICATNTMQRRSDMSSFSCRPSLECCFLNQKVLIKRALVRLGTKQITSQSLFNDTFKLSKHICFDIFLRIRVQQGCPIICFLVGSISTENRATIITRSRYFCLKELALRSGHALLLCVCGCAR